MQNLCGNFTTNTDKRDPSKVYGLDFHHHRARHRQGRGGVGHLGRDWQNALKYEQRAGVFSLVSTGGGLVFGGDANGRFRVRRTQRKDPVGDEPCAPVSGYPITAVDGKQYVSVATGPSGVANLDSRRRNPPSTTGQVFVFALP